MISDLLSTTVLIGILASGIRLATPYLYAAIGETFSQRSGVLNLGVEGQMLLGSFAAFYVALKTGSPWLGVLTAMLVGALMGLAMAYVTVNLHAEQGISGIGLYSSPPTQKSYVRGQQVGSSRPSNQEATSRLSLSSAV